MSLKRKQYQRPLYLQLEESGESRESYYDRQAERFLASKAARRRLRQINAQIRKNKISA